ncbi:MAG TPA: GNAT family N-acetyltransferase [Usitatibacteraceae bacterium]|nr:GNAT family N-acetyltransferase [Usitatibacteraceae bacterium]
MSTAELKPITPADFAPLAALAEQIWRAHYTKIISLEQIEYMLAGRNTPERLGAYVGAADRGLDLLWLDGKRVGFCSWAWTETPGEMKLEQIYLLPRLHGRGFGGMMLRHIEARARALGAKTMMLTVNKRNDGSIAVYHHAGFRVREDAVFDIGGGYVMDDYVMEKVLG